MVRVGSSQWHNQHTRADIGIAVERLLEPELLQCHLATTLHLGLIFTAFLVLYLHCCLGSAMLKLNLRSHRPSLAEIVPHIYHDVGQVELAILVILVFLRRGVSEVVVGVETAFHCRLAIPTDGQTMRALAFPGLNVGTCFL